MISIITPTYNSEKYLEECIKSIISQSSNNYEHIIVDGGSTDRTLEIIKKYEDKYNMRWISEPDDGMYDAINKGMKLARGEVLAWLNSDDMYLPWTTKIMEKIYNQGIQWCMGMNAFYTEDSIMYINSKSNKIYPKKMIEKGWMESRKLGSIQQESTFWSKELWIKSGGLNSEYKFAGDFHLWKQFAKFEELYLVNSVIAGFRIHPRQKSADREKYYNEVSKLNILEKIASKIKFYKVINMFLKFFYNSKVINIKNLE